MTKQKSTKRALLMSGLALLMCVSMLIGSTFAWFTDSVTSAGNKIQAGTLDIQLLMHDGSDYADISESGKPIFGPGSVAQDVNAETLWEPGKTQVAYLAIKNNGNLDLKYKVALNVVNPDDGKDLYKVMKYDIIENATYGSVSAWNATDAQSVVPGTNATQANDVELKAGAEHYFALAVHMDEMAGNEYQGGQVNFDLTVLATQLASESDSFNNQYDAKAKYPLHETKIVETTFGNYTAQVKVPAGAPGGDYSLDIPTDKVELVNNNSQTTLNFDMTLFNEGSKVKTTDVEYLVAIKLPHPFVDNITVLHKGEPVDNFNYDAATHTISFTTTNFSPFVIQLNDYVDSSFELDYKVEDGEYTIRKGMFVGKNPADFDASLRTADSKYITVDYVKDSVKYYVVSERATSVILGDADDNGSAYTFENGNIPDVTMINNGRLFKYLDKTVEAQANVPNDGLYKTVYLLPGTYVEATTLTVDTDKDIIGLGDPGNTNVIKKAVHTTKSKVSNRHLFNCTNSDPSEYIQVTIRNLTLESTEKNSYISDKIFNKGKQVFEDNAAVQSIRRAKVKCYDLVINKIADDASYKALYVNSNNKADDKKIYPAYMYAENVVMNTQSESAVVDATGTGKSYFYYNGVSYAGGATEYKKASGYIKNTTMAANYWLWE